MKEETSRALPARVRINYWVDVLIAVAFVVATVSGIVLLAAGGGGGWRGGRGGALGRQILLLDRSVWRDLHDASGIAMAVGVLAHLVLHARWIGCTTRNLVRRLRPRRARSLETCEE